jgi:hypothetical protein
MSGCLDVWMSGCLDVWMSGCLDVWMSGCLFLLACDWQSVLKNSEYLYLNTSIQQEVQKLLTKKNL